MAKRLSRRPPWPTDAKVTVAGLAVILVIAAASCSGGGRRASGRAPAAPAGNAATTAATLPDPASTSAPPTRSSPGTTAATTTAPATDVTPTTSGPSGATDSLHLLATLTVAAPNRGGYRRRLFGEGWAYDGSTGCNVRERVLIDESLDPPTMGPRCAPLVGRWLSIYDNSVISSPTQLQIDHLVPLADAWAAGASAWSAQQRLRYANDVTSPDTLIAVSAGSNESKGDRTPDEWLPPNRAAWCAYTARWVRVKTRWQLTVTSSEKAALEGVLANCG